MMGKALLKAKPVAFYALAVMISLSLLASFSIGQSLSYQAAPNSSILKPPIMTPTFTCPSGTSAQSNVVYSSNTVLGSDVCAFNILVKKNVVLQTNGYAIYALSTFINNGTVENRNGGGGGSSYSDLSGNGNGGNGPDTSSLTGSLAGGNGGAPNYQSFSVGFTVAWGSGGGGGGGANATGGYNSSHSGNSQGGNYGGGGGGGGAWAGGGNNGANGGGFIEIYADRFINNNLITVSGHNASGSAAWAGGGGGGGFVYIEITTSIPKYAVLGNIDANGGNAAGVSHSSYCGGGGGGGGGVIEITTNYGILPTQTYQGFSSSYPGLTSNGGSNSAEVNNAGCANGNPGSDGEIAITNLPPVQPPSGCTGPGKTYTETSGYCVFINSTYITTPYPDALGGSLEPSKGYTSAQPTTANQLNYEEQNAQWLLTCPIAPNPLYTADYFNTSTPQFISGNRCLASTNPLSTTITINTTVSWSRNTIANSTTKFTITNPGVLTVANLGYSGSAQTMNSSYAISNIYNTESYIFKQPSTTSESGVWTWTLEFVNFSKLTGSQISSLSQKKREFPKPDSRFPYLEYYNSTNDCLYNYTYSESVDFKGIQNQKIPIPVNLPYELPQRIVFQNGSVAETSNTLTAGTGCAQWLFWDGGVYGGTGCSFTVNEVSNSATFYYANTIQPGGSGCIAGSCQGHTSYVYTANDFVKGVNKYANDYLVATASYKRFGGPFNGCYNPLGCLYDYRAYAIPSSQLHFSEVAAIPYLLYNLSTPATVSDVNGRTRYLNESYDLYSPHNYLNPNDLEPYGLHTGSSFFATIINSSGSYFVEYPYSSVSMTSNAAFDDPNPDFITALNTSQQQAQTSSSNPLSALLSKPVGLFKSGAVLSPSYAIAAPNDFIYIINHTVSSGLFNTNTKSYLYTVRMIPFGYYNLTNIQPNFAVNSLTTDSPYSTNSLWVSAWESYWKDALAEQGQNYYITNLTSISSSNTYACWSWTLSCVNGKDAVLKAFIPTSVTSDYADDIFLAGLDGKNSNLELAAYFTNYSSSDPSASQVTRVISPSSDAGFKLAQEIATTSGGQFLYLSNSSYPNIPMFSSNTLTYERNISLSYSNLTYNLNISSYLAHGGPFGSNTVAAAYSGTANTLDVSSNHHPLAIFDYGDLLYVIDDWSFTVNGLPSSIMTMRVFFPNGTAIPIDGQNYDDMIANASYPGVDLSGVNISTTVSDPPYGWPLSANISVGNGNYVSYCAAGCEYGPSSSINYNGYPPIGPFITTGGFPSPNQNDLGFYMNYNGTAYMIAHVLVPATSGSCYTTRTGRYCSQPTYKGMYTEFLRFVPQVVNYTKISLSSYANYGCLINTSTSGVCAQNNYISQIYPPFAAAPSPIKSVLGEGSATDYYDAQALSESLFPNGLSGYGSSYASGQESGINSQSSNTALNSGLTNNGISSILPGSTVASFIKLTSSVGGYALIPYNASYTVTKSWQLISTDPSGCTNVLPSNTTLTYNSYSVLQVNATPSSSNALVEGGPTYFKDILSNLFYNANISDNNSIISPSSAYNIFTNRLFGSVMLNQSINSSGASVQKMINYSRLYNYSLYNVLQSAGGTDYPGYAYSKVELANISTTPPSNTPVYGVANSLITNPVPFNGNNIFTYVNNSETSFANLFQQFTYFKYYDLMSISFPNDGRILGYNRLIYVLQDSFNNTIYAPMDLDIANTTMINVNVNPIVSAINANQTLLNISGSAGYVSGIYSKSFVPLPEGSKIYLYYDTPLNYFNSSESPYVSSQLANYYTYAEKCAFGANPGAKCNFADPLNEYIQGSTGALEANAISYNPQYNSSGVCAAPPRHSLLNITVPTDCSIYNNTAVVLANTLVGNIPEAAYTRYCEPEYTNGTGVLTSQLGLAAIVSTNSNGGFSTNTITACGTGTGQIIAKYYGGPGPEPQKYSQPSIANSILSLSPTQTALSTYEYNYSFAPNQTSASFNLGSYYLSMGDISIALTLVAIAGIIAYQISSKRRQFSGIAHAGKRSR